MVCYRLACCLEANVDHEDVAITLYRLAKVYCEKGDITEAERLHRLSFEMIFRIDGHLSGRAWGSYQKMQALYELAHKALEKYMFGTAQRLFAECLHLIRRLHGGIEYHVDIAVVFKG